jgi:hypothetical protein
MKPTPAHPADLPDNEIEHHLRQSRQLEDAPEHVIQRAFTVWQPRRQAVAEPSLLQRLVAVLTFDSGAASPLAYGMRSGGGTTRQMLFSAQGHDVDLRISPADPSRAAERNGQWVLAGQVLGPQASGEVILANSNGAETARTTLNELGEFSLPAVTPGSYTVTLQLGATDIVLPTVQVPQTA